MSGRVAIVGAGSTGAGRFADRSAISLAHAAVSAALTDAGLDRSSIDGLAVHIGTPRGADYDTTAALLGLTVRYSCQSWSHGRFAATLVTNAALAIEAGLADYIVCVAAYSNSNFGVFGAKERPDFYESLREGGGPHAEAIHAGFTGPVAGAAMALQRYCNAYGVDREKLAAVPVTLRGHAQRNPAAQMRKSLSVEDYRQSRYIVEPLRLFDCSVVADGAVALILTTAQRARDCASRPVYLAGFQGINAGPNEYIFGQPGLGFNQAEVHDFRQRPLRNHVYEMAAVATGDVDLLYVYDAFSPLVWWTLERFGFCGGGEAADFTQDGRIAIGGELPVNTNGGMLSEGHLNGWTHFAEAIAQLRGQAEERQVDGAQIAQWGTALGDSIIFSTEIPA